MVADMPAKSTQIRYHGKTTYILGAGFSVAAGIPTMKHFLPTAFELLKCYENECYSENSLTLGLARLIDSKRAIASNSDIDVNNIEDLFCLVERTSEAMRKDGIPLHQAARSGKHGFVSQEPRKILIDTIINTLCLAYLQQNALLGKADAKLDKLIRDKLRRRNETPSRPKANECTVPQRHLFLPIRIRYKGKPCDPTFNICLYEAFWSFVLHRQAKRQENGGTPMNQFQSDAIITPNYDLVLEETLRSFQGAKIFYGQRFNDNPRDRLIAKSWRKRQAKVKIPLIKIHGSINWRYVDPGACTEGSGLEASEVRRSKPPLVEIWELMAQAKVWLDSPGVIRPVEDIPLQPPTWRKEPIRGGLFDLLARDAIEHLRTAEKIVVIGYSMPPTDFYLRSLLAEGLDTPERPAIEVWDIASYQEMEDRLLAMFGKSNASRIRFQSSGFLGFVKDKVNPNSLGGSLTRLPAPGPAKRTEKER